MYTYEYRCCSCETRYVAFRSLLVSVGPEIYAHVLLMLNEKDIVVDARLEDLLLCSEAMDGLNKDLLICFAGFD